MSDKYKNCCICAVTNTTVDCEGNIPKQKELPNYIRAIRIDDNIVVIDLRDNNIFYVQKDGRWDSKSLRKFSELSQFSAQGRKEWLRTRAISAVLERNCGEESFHFQVERLSELRWNRKVPTHRLVDKILEMSPSGDCESDCLTKIVEVRWLMK